MLCLWCGQFLRVFREIVCWNVPQECSLGAVENDLRQTLHEISQSTTGFLLSKSQFTCIASHLRLSQIWIKTGSIHNLISEKRRRISVRDKLRIFRIVRVHHDHNCYQRILDKKCLNFISRFPFTI